MSRHPLGRRHEFGLRVGRHLLSDRAGVTAIEYALMCALLGLAIIGGVNGYAGNLGTLMNATFSKLASTM